MEEDSAPVEVDVAKQSGVTLTWADGGSKRFGLEELRLGCPCAECRTRRETDRAVWPLPSSPTPLEIVDVELVGAYGMRITWNDGHALGIYSWKLLRSA